MAVQGGTIHPFLIGDPLPSWLIKPFTFSSSLSELSITEFQEEG